MLWNIIVWIVVGALAGWIASMIMGRNASMGAIANIIVGIIGAFVGGWVISLFGVDVSTGSLTFSSILTAILGAVIVLAIINLFTRGRVR